MQTIIYKMDKQQDPTASTGSSIQYPVINHNGKESEQEYKRLSEALRCMPETNTTL